MSTLRRSAIFALAAVGCLVAAEGAARLLAPALPEATAWPDESTAVKVAQLHDLGCADVVFAGDSVARDGFDPETFTAADPSHRSAYNAALDAAGPLEQSRWLGDQVDPALDPSVVVWALTSADLNDHAPAPAAALAGYTSSIGGRDDLLGRVQRPFLDEVALARYRSSLSDPGTLVASIRDRIDGVTAARRSPEGIPGIIGARGEGLSRRELAYEPGDPVVGSFAREQLLADFAVGGAQYHAAVATIDALRAGGVSVVLVAPPVTAEYVALHPDGQRSFARYRDAMTQLSDETGARLIDLTAAAPTSMFADTHHLNGSGAEWLSTELAAALADVAPDARRCPADEPQP